jgi:hypothetical protein
MPRTFSFALTLSVGMAAGVAMADPHRVEPARADRSPVQVTGAPMQLAQRYRPPRPIPRPAPRPHYTIRRPPTVAEIRTYNGMSQQMLYIELASAIAGQMQSASDGVRRGQRYFARLLPAVRPVVCASNGVRSFLRRGDVFAASSLIAEMIAARFGLPKATASMAVLAARMGLRELCPGVT